MQLNIERKDWIIERLGDFATSEKGKKPKNQSKEKTEIFKYPYVDIQGFEKNIFESYTDGENCRFCTNKDFLMVWDGSRSGLVGKAVSGAIGSTLVKISLPMIENSFAYYFLMSKYIEINTNAKGTGTPHVNPDLLWDYSFPITPLLEQKAIVQKIEQLFSELDNGVENLKKAKEKLKIYRQAVLKKAFEGELTKEWREKQNDLPTADKLLEEIKNERELFYQKQLEEWKEKVKEWENSGKEGKKPSKPKKQKVLTPLGTDILNELPKLNKFWNWTTIDNLIGFEQNSIKAGPFGSALKKSFYTETGYKIYGQEQVIAGDAYLGDYYVNEEKFNELINCKVKPNDILISLVGTVGKVLILPENIEDGIINPRLIKIGVHKKYYLPKLFKYYFESKFLKSIYKIHSHGATMDIINMSIIQGLPYPICSIEEQTQIVKEIESRLSVCDKIEETIESNLKKSESLRQSILKKAFEGKLLNAKELEKIQNDPNYESAEKLLERIKLKDKKTLVKKDTQKAKRVTIPKKISTDIHAGVIAKVIKAHVNNSKYKGNLTHIKCEKLSHLMEYHIGVDLGRVPVKDPAGPDDYPHLKKVEHRAKMAGYFGIKKQDIGHTYYVGKNLDKAIEKFEGVISKEQSEKFDNLVEEFLRFDLESSEIVATLYAGWNNLLIEGKTPSDEEIVYESRENWSKRKLKIPRERFFKALDWMRKEEIGLIPKGNGLKVEKPKKN